MYEFQCKKCKHQIELLTKLGETGEQLVCPHCNEKGLVKMVSSFSSPGIGGNGSCGSCTSSSCGSCCH